MGAPNLPVPPIPEARFPGYAPGAPRASGAAATSSRRRRAQGRRSDGDFSDFDAAAANGEAAGMEPGADGGRGADAGGASASTTTAAGAKTESLPSEKGGRRNTQAGVGGEASAPEGGAAPSGGTASAQAAAPSGGVPLDAGAGGAATAGSGGAAPGAAGAAALAPLSSLDGKAVSGMLEKRLDIGAYRIQLSETPDFAAPVFDKSFDVMSPIDLMEELRKEGVSAEREAYWVRIAFIDLLAIEEPFTKPRLYGLDKRRR